MSYKFYYSQGYSQHHDLLYVTERHSHTKVAYFSKHRMNEKYPGGGYEIIGEIGNFAKECATQDTILTESGKRIPIFPLGSFIKPFEWVLGYAPVGEKVYVAVIKSIIPRWIDNLYAIMKKIDIMRKFILLLLCTTIIFSSASIFLSAKTICFAATSSIAANEDNLGYGVIVGIIDSGVNKISENVLEGYNFLEDNMDTTDNKGHGTKIAGIILEVAPNAKIIPLKCTELNQINDNSAIIKAIYKAVDDFNCRVINISIGMPDSKELKDAIDYATYKSAIIISAVGNDGELNYKANKVYYPAGYENVVGVGSVNEDNVIAKFSQRNNSVFVVTSSREQGTSFSAARVSEAAAIAKGFNKNMSVFNFMNYLKEASVDSGDAGYDTSYGYGILDFELLLDSLKNDYPVYITYIDEQTLRLFNSKETTVNGILVFKGDDVISKMVEILPFEEIELNIENCTDCFFWQSSIFDIIWIKRGEK
ncbi:MAG TPA: S8 family serine peptidase [Clostridiaceae bacterium]|nr:S8 family serine peptidase [Clostridiaceae bacterium]